MCWDIKIDLVFHWIGTDGTVLSFIYNIKYAFA